MPQETHTKPTHAAGMVCCRDFEPFLEVASPPPDYDCAGESSVLTRASRAHAAVTQESALSSTCRWSPQPRSSLLCSRTWRTSSKNRRADPHTYIGVSPARAVFLSDMGATTSSEYRYTAHGPTNPAKLVMGS